MVSEDPNWSYGPLVPTTVSATWELPRARLTKEIEGSSIKIFGWYLIDVNTIPEIRDKVYATGKAIAFKLGMKQPEWHRTAKKDANEENRRERKLRRT